MDVTAAGAGKANKRVYFFNAVWKSTGVGVINVNAYGRVNFVVLTKLEDV